MPKAWAVPNDGRVDEVKRGGVMLPVTGQEALGGGDHRGGIGTAVRVAWHAAACVVACLDVFFHASYAVCDVQSH